MLVGGIQVVPLVVYTGQAKVRFAGNWPRWITCQEDGLPICLGRQMKPVICFLYLAQAECSRCSVNRRPKRLTDREDFGICPARRSTISLKLISMPERKVSGSTQRQVAGIEVL